jgi:hypothetical protein
MKFSISGYILGHSVDANWKYGRAIKSGEITELPYIYMDMPYQPVPGSLNRPVGFGT